MLSSRELLGLFDELEKISSELTPPDKKERVKRWLKASALTAGGVGAGTAIYMLGDEFLTKKLGPSWKTLDPGTRKKLLTAAALPIPILSMVGAKKLVDARREVEKGE